METYKYIWKGDITVILKNAKVIDENIEIIDADLAIENERIKEISSRINAEGTDVIDLKGYTILPGFIDQHTHGCAGFDTCDANKEGLIAISRQMATNGVTSYCPTTMTFPEEKLCKVLSVVRECMDEGLPGAYIQGVNMEGPFINKSKKGAQKGEYVLEPDYDMFRRINEKSGGIVKIVDIAPECAGADEFIKRARGDCKISIAHTAATYEQAMYAFAEGVSQATHLFNAMPGLNHRAPGVVGAVFDSEDVKAELICDGIHIHPAALRIAFKALGEDRTIIISDSMSAAGCPNGEYELGGQKVWVKDGLATLEDGTIAGSTTNLFDEFINALEFGIPLRHVLKSLTVNPAKQLGVYNETGRISLGKYADLIVINNNMEIKLVIIKGRLAVDNLTQR